MKHTITIIDDDPNSPLLKTDDRTPVLIRRRTDVDWERVSGWISVEDRMPSSGRGILLHTQQGSVLYGHLRSCAGPRAARWATPYRVLNDVTHWQPLPEPPTTE